MSYLQETKVFIVDVNISFMCLLYDLSRPLFLLRFLNHIKRLQNKKNFLKKLQGSTVSKFHVGDFNGDQPSYRQLCCDDAPEGRCSTLYFLLYWSTVSDVSFAALKTLDFLKRFSPHLHLLSNFQ